MGNSIPFLLKVFLLPGVSVSARVLYSDLFTTYDEYDFAALDPFTAFGSPYGGFSRATRSRLASLPLHLPEISDENPIEENPFYVRVRDANGRLFACRLYHEDELDPSSLYESVFDAPKLRVSETASGEGSVSTQPAVTTTHMPDVGSSREKSSVVKTMECDASGQCVAVAASTPSSYIAGLDSGASSLLSELEGLNGMLSELGQSVDKFVTVQTRLTELTGLCGQIHKGWWSYDWCFEQDVSQFHVEIDEANQQLKITNKSNLGKFRKRSIKVDLSDAPLNELAEDAPELARVTDEFLEGDYCGEANEHRKAYVHMICCSEKVMGNRRPLLHRDGDVVESNIASLFDLVEDTERVCTYNVTVCTPLLCAEPGDANTGAVQSSELSSLPKENESIRDILARTLNKCIQVYPGTWWSYEFCHGKSIRQFHEKVGTKKTKAGATVQASVVDSEFRLGYYDRTTAEAFPDEEEWKYVVNSTKRDRGGYQESYFELEYTGGDVCDDPDVTKAAVIAGTATAGGISRSSSVRYSCGHALQVQVSEDNSCHYLVHVKVPDLCKHPLFKTPVSKKQAYKCLPASERK